MVRRGERSPDVLPKFSKAVPEDIDIQAEEALRKLASAAEKWQQLTGSLTNLDRTLLAREALSPDERRIIMSIDNDLDLKLFLDQNPSKLQRMWARQQRRAESEMTESSDEAESENVPESENV